jgi:hypothetical protein
MVLPKGKPEIASPVGTTAEPDPIGFEEVVENAARVELSPHSNQASVASPFGFTVPLRVAAIVVMAEADPVVTVGAMVEVLKLAMAPLVTPVEFEATNRK